MMKLADIVRASKILPYFLVSFLFFPHQSFSQVPIKWTMINEPSRVVSVDNKRFKASLVRTKKQPSKMGWYIKDQEGNVIGDKVDEIPLYKKVAKTATISRYIANSYDLDRVLSSYISNFRKSLYGILAAKTAEFIRDIGSKIEGKLIRVGLTAHEDLDIEDIAKIIYTEVRDGLLKRFGLDDSKVYSINDIAQRLKENSTLTSLIGIAESIHRLEKAREIVRNTSIWPYDNADMFYKLYKFGLLEGIAHLELLNRVNEIENLGWKKQAELIVKNFGEGFLGESFGELFKKSARNRDLVILFKDEVRKRASKFDPIDEFYSFKECSGNIVLLADLLSPSDKDFITKEEFEKGARNSNYVFVMPLTYANLDCYTEEEAIFATMGVGPSQFPDSVRVSTILNIFRLRNEPKLTYRLVVDETLMHPNIVRKLNTKIDLRDVTGDGIPEVVIESEPQGSGGYTEISVVGFNGLKFDMIFHSGVIKRGTPIYTTRGLVIRKDYPRENDPNCCPSRFKETLYTWNNKKKKLIEYESRIVDK